MQLTFFLRMCLPLLLVLALTPPLSQIIPFFGSSGTVELLGTLTTLNLPSIFNLADFSQKFLSINQSDSLNDPLGGPSTFVGQSNLVFDLTSISAVSEIPLPAALPLFATGLGALGLFGWRRKRKQAA